MEYFQSFLFNACLLTTMVFIYIRISHLFPKHQITRQVYCGVLFGLIAIIVMNYSVHIMPGFFLDTRSIIVSISGFFGGPMVVAITVFIAVAYRIIQGGLGTLTGISIILVSGGMGLGYYYLRKKYTTVMKPLYIYLFGLLVHLAVLFCMFILPFHIALDVLNSIMELVLIICPIISFLIVSLLLDQEKQLVAKNIIKDQKKSHNILLENLLTGVIIHAPDTRIIFCNNEASRLIGIPIDEMCGKADIDFDWSFVCEDGSKMPTDKYPVSQVLTTQQPLMGYTIGVNRGKNDLVWVLVNAFPEFNLDQELSQIVVTFIDITKVKQSKRLLEKQQKLLETTFDSIQEGIIVTDIDARVTSMNPEAERLTGWKFSEANKKPLKEIFNGIAVKTFQTASIKKMQNDGDKNNLICHNTLISKDGSKCQIFNSCTPIKDKTEEVLGLVLVFRDISEEWQIKESMKKRVKELEFLRNLSEILEIKDISLKEICQKTLEILPVAFQYPDIICLKIIIDGVEYKTDNYKETKCRLSTDIKDFGKLDICYLENKHEKNKNAFLHEEYELVNIVTERLAKAVNRKYTAESLFVAKKDAECANQVKSEFLANMSHEIRSPLNGLLGFSEIMKSTLQQSKDCEHQDKLLAYLDIIEKCGQDLTELITDILDLSDIKVEKTDALLNKFSPEKLIAESVEILNFKAKEKDIVLTFQHDNLPLEVIGVKKRLKQILFNLVGNAIKFTDNGSVKVKADYKDNNLLIEVEDTGIGISDDMKDKILEPFTQVYQSSSKKHRGAGLGLAIISRVLDNIGGSLNIKSELNKGTMVSFVFPVKINEYYVSETTMEQTDQKRKPNILVVEDNEITGLYLDKILDTFGANYKIAKSFAHMQEVCEQGFIPDAALIDISLPDADGFECMEWVKNKFPEEDVKCIAQTAHVLKNDIIHYQDAGFDDFICKPYMQEQIIDILRKNLKISSL